MEALISIFVAVIGIYIMITLLKNSESTASNEQNTHKSTDMEQKNGTDVSNAEEEKEEPEVYSDFQMTLQNSTKTPAQVRDEENAKLIEEIKKAVYVYYKVIKNELLEKAETGKYSVNNGKKVVTVDCDGFDFYIHKCTSVRGINLNKDPRNILRGPYNLKCTITNKIVYEEFLRELKKYADADNVKFKVILLNRESGNSFDTFATEHDVPCDVTTKSFFNRYKFIVRASVRY